MNESASAAVSPNADPPASLPHSRICGALRRPFEKLGHISGAGWRTHPSKAFELLITYYLVRG